METPATETTAKPAKAPKAPKEKKERARGVGTAAIEAIKSGLDNAATLEAVRKEFPQANTSLSSINWYRNKLRHDGVKGVKSAREIAAAKKAAEEKAAKAEAKAAKAAGGNAGDPLA